MEMTKAALKLFMQSLPPGSVFDIIGFGSTMHFYGGSNEGVDYSDAELSRAKNQIQMFQADLGGTEIYMPLRRAFELNRNGY